ncbi:hypothetical protein [Capnocytophaga canimorsus]|uniref:hypothetical protein n=1 Tax=Capnocytophaga canimorsus TaxID=28188 RepID=UPI0037D320C0
MKINNTHISTLQAHLLDGSLASLLSYPALKTPAKNDWAEHHGTEYDLQNLYLKSKEITLKITLPISQWEDFKNLILTNLYADYYFSMIDRTYRLRFVGFAKTEYFAGNIQTELKLSDDEPTKGYIYQPPTLTAYDTEGMLNGKKLSDYGICLLRRAYRFGQEISENVFDGEGYFNTEKIKPLSIDTKLISVGSRMQQFALPDVVISVENTTTVRNTQGKIVHLTLEEHPV